MKNSPRPTLRRRAALLGLGVLLALLGNGPVAMAHLRNELPVIPAPRAWTSSGGAFNLADLRKVAADPDDPVLLAEALRAASRLAPALERELPLVDGPGFQRLHLHLEPQLGVESYRLKIVSGEIDLAGGDAAGLQHGVTTLVQLALHGGPVPAGVVEDGPAFGWRGLLLDCGRHFMPVDVVKGVIDRLAMHKFNVLHWHLTEDQGWRLEIPEYPRLTEVGAWRTDHDGRRYGGFYTADDVAEVLAYAAARHITVVPEIEMPGHALAALAAHPELSCTGGPFDVETQWGIHEDVFCAGNDAVFTFLETVLTRVMAMFPAGFIHIGGDEVPKARWKACAKCRARLKAEGLANEDELQSWFIARIEAFLQENGRRLIGWDEILEGGLADRTDRAVVQAWRGHDHATRAARAGLDVIVSPTSHAYFDYDPVQLPVSRVFAFDPVPAGLADEHRGRILGGAGNLWTEYVPPSRVDTMLFPRLGAMAEALWTADPDRDFYDFHVRWLAHGPVLEHLGAVPGPAARPVILGGSHEEGGFRFEATIDDETRQAFAGHELEIVGDMVGPVVPFAPEDRPEDRDLPPLRPGEGHGSTWTIDTPAGDEPLAAQARLFVDGRPYGAPAVIDVQPHRALGLAPAFARQPSRRYPGGLTDGLRGGRRHQDGRWSGFEGSDLEVVLDLGRVRDLQEVSTRFLQDANAWILLPRGVALSLSTDGETWSDLPGPDYEVLDRVQDPLIREFVFNLEGFQGGSAARFVRLVARNFGPLPDWHPGRGQPAWIFVDEIVVR